MLLRPHSIQFDNSMPVSKLLPRHVVFFHSPSLSFVISFKMLPHILVVLDCLDYYAAGFEYAAGDYSYLF